MAEAMLAVLMFAVGVYISNKRMIEPSPFRIFLTVAFGMVFVSQATNSAIFGVTLSLWLFGIGLIAGTSLVAVVLIVRAVFKI